MSIAYMILAHEQPELFGRLVAAVHAEDVAIHAHIDGKKDPAPFAAACAGVPVKFAQDPVKVYWGGYSQVAAMFKLLEQAVQSGNQDYYIFLSGRDYPLQSHSRLLELMRRHPGRNYMNFYALVDGTVMVNKIRRYCYYDIYAKFPTRFVRRAVGRIVKEISKLLPERRFIAGMQPYRGSTSWCISRDVARYIVDFVNDPRNAEYVKFFHSVNCADEVFFQTIVLNSPYAETLNLFDVDGRRPHGEMKNENKASLHYIDWNPEREDPAILVDSDLDPMIASGKFFARKFDFKRSSSVMDKIDALRAAQERETKMVHSAS